MPGHSRQDRLLGQRPKQGKGAQLLANLQEVIGPLEGQSLIGLGMEALLFLFPIRGNPKLDLPILFAQDEATFSKRAPGCVHGEQASAQRHRTAATGTWSSCHFLPIRSFCEGKGFHGEKWPRKLEGRGGTKEGRELQTGAQQQPSRAYQEGHDCSDMKNAV